MANKWPKKIKRFISVGELTGAEQIGDTAVLLQRMGRLLDKAHAQEIFGDIVFEDEDGNFHNATVEGVINNIDASHAANFEEEYDDSNG